MSTVAQLLEQIRETPQRILRDRTALNLPPSDSTFPLGRGQREALDLILSNAPCGAIAGPPGSGKTHIAMAALEQASKHQRSVLVVAPYLSILGTYGHLAMPMVTLRQDQDYRQQITTWLHQNLAETTLDFMPPHWLPDEPFEALQRSGQRSLWIQRLNIPDPTQRMEALREAVAEACPQLHPHRQMLLCHRLIQAKTLLEQREQLQQQYRTLAPAAVEAMVDSVLPHFPIPVLCELSALPLLGDRQFDLVIGEQSQGFTAEDLTGLARHSKKLILLGELSRKSTAFSRYFQQLSAAYRLELTENYRLHPLLAQRLFPLLFPRMPLPHTPRQSVHRVPTEASLVMEDIRDGEQLFAQVVDGVRREGGDRLDILTFSPEVTAQFRQGLAEVPSVRVTAVSQWPGQECDRLWIVYDHRHDRPPNLTQWQLVLTRARHQIKIFGDRQQYGATLKAIGVDREFLINRELSLDGEEALW